MRIAIQGEKGSFSEAAALHLRPAARMRYCASFAEAFQALMDARVDRALMPIENSLAGAVGENYDWLRIHPVHIQAELLLRIRHHLIVPPGQSARTIRRVLSHPVALQQCRDFLLRHPRWHAEAYYDTAGSVKHLMRERPPATAAIAGEPAARAYGARILYRGIEDNPQNYTRFVLLGRSPNPVAHGNKISIVFITANRPGALFKALAAFALRAIDLTRIESRPIAGKPWEYSFYLDFRGNLRDPGICNALRHLDEMSEVLKVIGCYKEAEEIYQ